MVTTLRTESYSGSNVGLKRAMNQDTIECREPATEAERARNGAVWCIADGFGPSEGASRASRMAARHVVDHYWNAAAATPADRLREAVRRTNQVLVESGETGDGAAGATIVAAVVHNRSLYVASLGKARAYLISDGGIEQLTRDHTWVAAELAAGRLTDAEARTHPRRNVVTRALGVGRDVRIDLVERDLHSGDLVLLCSDGLTRHVGNDEIAEIVSTSPGDDPVQALIDAANRGGGSDNTSIVLVRVQQQESTVSETGERLAVLQSAGRSLGTSLDLDETINSVMKELLALLGGEHAAVVLSGPDGEPQIDRARQFVLKSDGSVEPADGERLLSASIVRQVVRDGEPVIVGDALNDARYGSTDSIVGLSLRSILCVPLRTRDRTVGVLYLDSSVHRGAFTRDDLDLLVAFAGQATVAIENARLYEEAVKWAEDLSRSQAHQRSIIRSMSLALIAVDGRHRVTVWNPATEQLTGVPASTAISEVLDDLLPGELAGWLRALAAQATTDGQTAVIGHEWRGSLAGRDRVQLMARIAVLNPAPDDATREGFVFLINDQTDMMLLEEARQNEAERRQQISDLFGRYLAPEVADQLLQSPGQVRLGGTQRDVTILFADLRGFTTFSEHRQPEEVVSVLNRFLSLASGEVFAELGTLDKFLGDGVMAVFNAPASLEDHAGAAIRAALRMRLKLNHVAMNTDVRMGFGIGIHSGPAIVGNIGAQELMSYTAIGDTVNVAARLEAEAEIGDILISEATYTRIGSRFAIENLGPRPLRGRTQPVNIYRVLDDGT